MFPNSSGREDTQHRSETAEGKHLWSQSVGPSGRPAVETPQVIGNVSGGTIVILGKRIRLHISLEGASHTRIKRVADRLVFVPQLSSHKLSLRRM